ncbi:hypothetical protein SPRG_05243 [Saprolegnia parasitica CBS 223.65]|uniref:Uncharacterized protein n=1 Tax=Saprolegnia parasitica (strain CBS 223.65) TaxID=695850 RepID=A0A067CTD6_SAPPC|nr:hypothetical protein SPRG_05243 [Saprolegnia parasitica CBS 223.65]KDO30052.1 hypothetical protein SPRG_05243 [Saprolegnia parasitica CBS 223.65]|eukprot:XP_012199233.1 hypothetical protein SPRG_05243 [Saprolegnia parasitica CBS 223.65]
MAALRAQRASDAAARAAKDVANRDHTRSLLKLIALDSEFRDDLIAFDEECKLQCERHDLQQQIRELDAEYQAVKYAHAGEGDKRRKHELLAAAKAKRDQDTVRLRAKLAELGDPPSSPTKKTSSRLSSSGVKEMKAEIKRLWREKQAMPDPKVAYLEIGKLLRKLGDEAKAIEYVAKAVGPNEKATNAMVPPTPDELATLRRIEHKRLWEAHSILFHYYLKLPDAQRCEGTHLPLSRRHVIFSAEHMTAYLALADGDQRIKTLIYLDKLLRRASGVDQIGQPTAESMTQSILVRRSLGCLPDLRFRVLTQLSAAFPQDAYLLASIASLNVRLHDFGAAKTATDAYTSLPEIARLHLSADVLEYAPAPALRWSPPAGSTC